MGAELTPGELPGLRSFIANLGKSPAVLEDLAAVREAVRWREGDGGLVKDLETSTALRLALSVLRRLSREELFEALDSLVEHEREAWVRYWSGEADRA